MTRRSEAQPSELGPYRPVSDLQVLAALDRAQRHSPHGYEPGVLWGDMAAHLGFVRAAATTLKLRSHTRRLRALRLIERRKEGGHALWRVTSDGRRRLTQARRQGEELTLPEAPQHRLWRTAHALAGEQIDGLREQVRQTVRKASAVLDSEHGGDSAVWFELRDRLGERCQQLAAASFCLREWPEPDDARADLDRSEIKERRRSFNSDVLQRGLGR